MQRKVLLNKSRYASAEGANVTPRISLSIDKEQISESQYNEAINEYNVYLDERESCTKIRLTAQVNLVASNVLFNRVTEIVKNEGGDNCECLNFTPKAISSAYGKPNHKWGSDMIMATHDTQITYDGDEAKNYTYLCGIDIFNSHILRALNKLPNYYYQSKDGTDNGTSFNTLSDIMCDSNGFKWLSKAYTYTDKKMHLYRKNDILSYMDCINEKMCDKDGWLGFVNCSKMESYDISGNTLGIGRVLNNETTGKFIDLYPGRTHYQLMPYYNKLRHRNEKNWDYCLTYPYSSTTEGINCINGVLKTLKISHIDENTLDDTDLYKAVIYSVSKHGLKADDLINIYKSNNANTLHELAEEQITVDSVIDDYTFSIYTSEQICKRWISIYDEQEISGGNFSYASSTENKYISNGVTYRAFNEYINFDIDSGENIGSQNLSFAKVVNGEQCEYYARIFSRFPNFDFATDEPSEEFAYSKDSNGIRNVDKYNSVEYEKTSTMTKIGYSKNIYNDPIVQIVFNDDININGLKDNLGRPLTSLYITFMKTNHGHDIWYDTDDYGNTQVGNSFIEHSHCFGKLNCGFKYNPSLLYDNYETGNINFMNNVDEITGFTQASFKDEPQAGTEYEEYQQRDDEIGFDDQRYFLGDLCEYSTSQCVEVVLQPIYFRFNTQQRELENQHKQKSSFGQLEYQEISFDEYEDRNFYTHTYTLDTNPTSVREGYYYQPHYEIPIRTFSGNLSQFSPAVSKISSMSLKDNLYTIQTNEENYVNLSDNVFIYDLSGGTSTQCIIQNILSTNIFTFSAETALNIDDLSNYRVYIHPTYVPSYAIPAKDGSGVLRWREINQNGFETMDGIIEEYPFTNGCLYVNKRINIFLKRQDPFGEFGLADDLGMSIMCGYPSAIENPEYASEYDDNTTDEDNSYVNEKNGVC